MEPNEINDISEKFALWMERRQDTAKMDIPMGMQTPQNPMDMYMKMMQMQQMFGQQQPKQEKASSPKEFGYLSFLQEMSRLMDPARSKQIRLFVKCQELSALMQEQTDTRESREGNQLKREILFGIRPYLSEERQNMVDIVIKMYDMKQMMGMAGQ